MDTSKLEKQLQDIITDYANKIWDNHKELNYNADKAVEFEEAIWNWIKQNFIPLELQVKHANAELNLIAGMYAVLQSQLSCVWNKIAGKDTIADRDAKILIPKIEALNKEIEKRLSV